MTNMNPIVELGILEIVKTDPERKILLIRGSLPGAANGLVLVRKV